MLILVALLAATVPAVPVNASVILNNTLFSDNFERGWKEINGNWTINNDGTGNYIYTQNQPYYIPGVRSITGTTSWTNYTVQVKVNVTGTSSGRWGGLLLRVTAPGNATSAGTYYELYLQEGGKLQLVKTVAGVRNGITNPSVGNFYNEWWNIKAEVNGTSIKGKAWKATDPEPTTWLIDYVDSTPIKHGKIGLITFSNVASQPVHFDNVTVKNLSGNTLFSDNFELKWTEIEGAWTVINDGTSNHVIQGSGGSGVWARVVSLIGDTSWTNYSMSVRMKVGQGGDGYGGLLFRVQDAGPGASNTLNTYYRLETLDAGSGEQNKIKLWKWLSGTPTKLAEASFTPGTGWHTYKVTVTGSSQVSIKVCVDGAPIFDLIDSTSPIPNGKVGLETYQSIAQYDDIVIKDISMNFKWLQPVDGAKTAYKIGSTIPIKFTILTGDDINARELKVIIQKKTDLNWVDVTSATSTLPLYGHTKGADEYLRTGMSGEHYKVNWHTKVGNVTPGTYRFKVSFDGMLWYSSEITLIQRK